MLKYDDLTHEEQQIAQIVSHILAKSKDGLTATEILAIIYLADRYHLRMCGRLIINPLNGGYWIVNRNLPPINKKVLFFLNRIIDAGGLT